MSRSAACVRQRAGVRFPYRHPRCVPAQVEPGFRRFASLEDFIWARLMVASRNFSIRVRGRSRTASTP